MQFLENVAYDNAAATTQLANSNLVPRLFPLPRERPWLGLATWHPHSES